MRDAVLFYLIIVPAGILCLLPMKNQLRLSLGRVLLRMLILFAVLIPGAAWILVYYSPPPNAVLLPLAALLFAVYHYYLRVHISKSLAVFSSVMALMAILGMFSTVFDALRNPQLGADSYTPESSLFYLGISAAAVLLLAFPFLKYGSRVIDRLDLPGPWYWTIPFSALLFFISLYIRPRQYATMHVNRIAEAALAITCVFLAFWILTHVMFYYIVMGILEYSKTWEEKRILELQESQFSAQQRYMEATARERHDFRHSIRTLHGLCEAGDLEAARKYLRQYMEKLPVNDVQSFCGNQALNALLNHYVHLAVHEGIDTQIETRLPDTLPITDIDLCRITGNLFENAITAAGQAQEKWIRLSLAVMNGSVLYIVVTNSFDGKVRMRRGWYLSTRRGGRGKGIGLSSIRSTVESYGGVAKFRHEGSVFYSDVAIPLKKGKSAAAGTASRGYSGNRP